MKCNLFAVFGFQLIYLVICASENRFTSILNRFKCGKVHCDDLVVELKQGKLQGRAYDSVLNNAEYYAFLGVPYAKPPLGELRFQAPRAAEPWLGIYDATFERSMCQQADFMTNKFVRGSEDCLHLNVYIPQLPRKIDTPKPVMVSIHGGGFCRGSGTRRAFSADYLITHDIILVSLNYRLLILGFLNLGLPDCSGNVGLKDQVEALKWVKENIAEFGGDPNNITIFGESAGASSVHYHMLSPLSKGLFHKAIMQSGSALSPWAITYNPIEQAFEIGRRCGFRGNHTKELLNYLKNQPGHVVTTAAVEMILHNREIYPARLINISPSVEMVQEGAFLPDRPENLAKNATLVPTIFGVNNKEGILLFLDMNKNLVQKVRDDFSLVVTNNFKVNPDSVPELSAKIKQFYFGDEPVGLNSANNLVDLYSDIYFYYLHEAMDFLTNSSSPPYVYEFSFDGQLNYFKRLVNFLRRTKLKGASHADELFYLFYQQIMPFYPRMDDDSLQMIDSMTLMWTNFAKTGNPSGQVEWKPSTSNESSYLQIEKPLKMVSGKLYEKRLNFLKNLLDPATLPGTKPYNIF